MASVFVYHVIGDLTVGKPEMIEFLENETVESAILAIGTCTEGGIPVWKKKTQMGLIENSEMRQQRFVGIINSLDIVSFLAREECLKNQEMGMKTPVSEFVVPNKSLLKEVDPGTRFEGWVVLESKLWFRSSTCLIILHNGNRILSWVGSIVP